MTVRPYFGFQKFFIIDGFAIKFFFNTISDHLQLKQKKTKVNNKEEKNKYLHCTENEVFHEGFLQ